MTLGSLFIVFSILGSIIQYTKIGDLVEKKKIRYYSLTEKEGARAG
jgi:hypothetical protein